MIKWAKRLKRVRHLEKIPNFKIAKTICQKTVKRHRIRGTNKMQVSGNKRSERSQKQQTFKLENSCKKKTEKRHLESIKSTWSVQYFPKEKVVLNFG